MVPHGLIFAFGFANLSMLFWLGAAAVPVVIHLWSRRRHRETVWAAMEFLLAAIRRDRRRLQLEQWILLAARILVIVLVVMAVAEPFFEPSGFAFVPGERTHRVIVLDGSYSMGYRPDAKTLFEQAKTLAGRIVEESPQGDGFTLVLLGSPPRVVIGNPVFERRDFLPELEGLALPHATADLSATLLKVEQVLVSARREHPKLARQQVYFLTDLQRVGWLGDPDDKAAAAAFLKRSRRLAESARLVVIDLGHDGAENVAVSGLFLKEPYAVLGRNVEVSATLENFGREMRSRQPVGLYVDGRRVAEEFVDLGPESTTSMSFSHRFETPGDHAIEIRTKGDRLDIDNRRFAAISVKPYIEVLCVDGRPSGRPFGGATGYLVTALSPEGDAAGRAMVRPREVPESRLLELDLERYDCVFLSNVAQFTSSEARALETYLRRGGSLVFFLGDQVRAERYNRELGGEASGSVRLLPARLGPIVSKAENRLDPLGYAHPIVAGFRHHEKAGLLTTPVKKHFRLLVPKRTRAKVALSLAGGDPLIVEEPIHQGRVVMFATSADTSWTLMPTWPSYLPLVRDALAYAIGEQHEQQNAVVGESFGATVSADAADVPLSVQRPDGRRDEVRLRVEEGSSLWSYAETDTSGIYTAEFGSAGFSDRAFAVNVDPAEGDLARLSAEQLHDDVWPGVSFLHQTDWQNLDHPSAGRVTRQSKLPKMLLYAVLGLLFVETFLAWRFGHHQP